MSSFEELLTKDNSFSIHIRNIQDLAIELCKLVNGRSPKIMRYPAENKFITRNVNTARYDTDT